MESTDISLQLKALQQAIQNINNSNNEYAAQNQSQARQVTTPLGKPIYGTEGTAPYIPFAPGTPTLASRQFAEQQKQNDISNKLEQAKYNLSVSKAFRGGGSSAPKLNATERKNDLLGSMTTYVSDSALRGIPYGQTVNDIWGNMDEADRRTLSLSDVQGQVKRVYELNGIKVESGGASSGNGSQSGPFGAFGEGAGTPGSTTGSAGQSNSHPFIPFDPNLQGNFASPFDRIAVGKTPSLANFPWYAR